MKKEGSGFDLPIAVGILGAYGALRIDDLSQFLLVGELGLDGGLRPIPGMLPVAIMAREKNIPNLILPAANAAEAAVVEGVNVYPVSSLLDVLELLNTAVVGVIQREPFRCLDRGTAGRAAALHRGLQGCARAADGQARAGGCGGGEPQHPDDRAAGLGQNHAGQAAAVDPGAAELRGSAGDHQDSFRGRGAGCGGGPGDAAAVPLSAPHHLRCRTDRRRRLFRGQAKFRWRTTDCCSWTSCRSFRAMCWK